MAAGRKRRTERDAQYESSAFLELKERLASTALAERKRQSLTQEEAAHKCAMSTRLWQQVESGGANVTLTTLARVVEGLEIDPVRLFRKPR